MSVSPDEVARRHWHAVAFERQLDDGPVAVTLLGEALVVARLGDEVLVAPDRCAHRGAPLSMGDVRIAPSGEVCLVCPYHALHLDHRGRATHLPARPDDRLPARLDVTARPALVRHGIVWASLDPEPIGGLPNWPAFDDEANVRFQLGPEPWAAMPSRIVENFNDLAHFATVHAATFGASEFAEVPPIEITPTVLGFDHRVHMHQIDRVTLDGPLVPIEVEFAYVHVFPFVTELVIHYSSERTEWIQVAFTPVSSLTADEPRSLVFQQNVRNFDLDGDISDWHDFQAAVNAEDRDVLEAIRPAVIGVDGSGADEVGLSFDDFTVAYRRRWRELLGDV